MHQSNSTRSDRYAARPGLGRPGFTLVELLIVVAIIALLASMLGVTISAMLTGARETQTLATIQKLDGLVLERQKAMERFFLSPQFRRVVEQRKSAFDRVIPGLSNKFVETFARKQFQKFYLPQSFADFVWAGRLLRDIEPGIDVGSPPTVAGGPRGPANGIPDRIEGVEFPPKVDLDVHDSVTESAELLYFALTELDVFGVPPIGTDAFSTNEVADTDGDGLKEFVDGWGQPLRFYRWPTRLFKPYGLLGPDGQPGAAGTNDNASSESSVLDPSAPHTDQRSDNSLLDAAEIGWPGTDDVIISGNVRNYASVYFAGLPRPPAVAGQYDLLNADPDDPFGLLISESRRYAPTGVDLLSWVPPSLYHDLDTYHKPLIVSAGQDGFLGLYEPFVVSEDFDGDGSLDAANRGAPTPPGFPIVLPAEDVNGNGSLDVVQEDFDGDGDLDVILGYLAMPRSLIDSDGDGIFDVDGEEYGLDDISNRDIRAGGTQ